VHDHACWWAGWAIAGGLATNLTGLHLWRAQPLHENSKGSGDPNNTQFVILECNYLHSKSFVYSHTVRLTWLGPLRHGVSMQQALYFSRCTSLVELWWNILGHGCTLHSSRWLGSLLAHVFWITQFMLIHVAIRSTLFYTSLDSWGRTQVVYIGVTRPFRIFVEGLRAPD
jgi:hypothetical protein